VYLNAGEVPVAAEQAAALLVGQSPSRHVIEEAAMVASQQEVAPMGDIHATADFKRHLVKVLTGRALKQAFARAGNG
ncbi:MAG TPA: xanthine dehydrogenase family protein subunit M, partial [Anaerolineae bacterium]